MPAYLLDAVFQHKLIGLLKDGVIDGSLIQPTYFQNPILSELILAIRSLQKHHITPITKRMLYNETLKSKLFRDQEYREDLRDAIDQLFKPVRKSDSLFIIKNIKDYNRLQTYKQALLQAESLLQDPDSDTLERLDSLFSEQIKVDSSDGTNHHFYFSGLIDRLKERNKEPEVIQSLIPPLDKCLDDGGFAPEEINLFVGLPSAGKSFALLHMAKVAVAQKKKVAFFSLEMTSSKLSSRLDAAYLGVKTHEIREHAAKLQRTLKRLYREFGDSLVVIKLPAGQTTVSDIRNELYALQLRGFKTDVVVLDYMNLMAPAQRSREGRHRDLGQVYIDMKGLTQEQHLWFFTAAQSNREGAQMKLITMSNLADSFEGSMHADVVISLNRDDQDAKRGKLRLYLAKDKNGIDKQTIHISTNYSQGAFYKRDSLGGLDASNGETSQENGQSQGQESQKKPRKTQKKKTQQILA